ncbi:MAG: hypothetical protein ACO2PM_08345 [Pyrobaculum sp.]|jgi:hypothetical protein
MYLHSMPAASEEEFQQLVLTPGRRIGLDMSRGFILSEEPLPPPFLAEGKEREAVELCAGRPPLPVVAHYPTKGRGGPRVGASTAPRGVIWLDPIGIFHKGREWRVATSCKARPPLVGWERVTVDAVAEVLQHVSYWYWMFWPRGIRVDPRGSQLWTEGTELLARRKGRISHMARGVEGRGNVFKAADEDALIADIRSAASADELMHIFVAGASASGKTTLVKSIIGGQRYVVIDITPKGEYAASLGPAVEGGINFSSFTVEERVQLLTLAFAATLGKEDASFSPVQFGALRRFGAVPLENLLTTIAGAPDLPQLSKQVMIEKLASLCAEVDTEYNCIPHPLLVKQVNVKPPAAVRVSVEDPFLQAVVVHGILMRLLKTPQQQPTFVVIDEYHRVAAKVENIEDPVEKVIRMGRHGNWHMIISTQSPLELKTAVISIIPTHIYFQLHGEAAKLAGAVLNVDPAVISSLGPGQWLAVVRSGPGRPAWHRRSP